MSRGLSDAARRAGALDVLSSLPAVPSGWDTVLSRSYDGGVELSGGQWQRVALARALFAVRHGATILVLDEPTAWLDARGEADFFDRFLEITEGTTTLIISHRFSTVRRADHICVLDEGRVLEQGDHGSLIAAGGRYAELFGLQAARFGSSPSGSSGSLRVLVRGLRGLRGLGVSWRVWRSALGWGWRAAPGWLVYTGVLLVAGAVTSVVYPVGLALVIDSAIRHRAGGVVAGVVLVGFLYTVSWALAMLAGTAGAVLSDRTSCYLTARIAEQLHAVSGVDHLERPAYLTELDLLQQNLRLLGNAPRQILLVIQVLVRTAGIVVILAVIFPLLGVLPLAACFRWPGSGCRSSCGSGPTSGWRPTGGWPTSCSSWPRRPGRRRSFGCSGSRDAAGAAPGAGRADLRGTARAAVLGGLCGALGWLLFAGAFVAGIAVVAVRAAHGTASVGAVVLAVTLVQRAQLQVGQAANAIGQLLTTARTARRLLWLEDYAAADPGASPGGAGGGRGLPPAGAVGGRSLPPAAGLPAAGSLPPAG